MRLHDEVEVAKRGGSPDPAGSRYGVIEYEHDPVGRRAAHTFAHLSRYHRQAISEALTESLAGGEESPALRTYTITPHDEGRLLVVNYAKDYASRVAVVTYAKLIDDPDRAQELLAEVKAHEGAFAEHMQHLNEEAKRSQKLQRRRRR